MRRMEEKEPEGMVLLSQWRSRGRSTCIFQHSSSIVAGWHVVVGRVGTLVAVPIQ